MSVTAEEIDQRRRVRGQRKGVINRHLGNLRRFVAEEDVEAVQVRLGRLKDAFNEFECVHEDYHKLLSSDADISESEQWFSDVESHYISEIKAAREWLNSKSVSRPINENVNSSVNAGDDKLISLLSIPKLELPTFCGDPLEYPSFIAIFDESVDSKVNDDQIKLTRLLQYTTGPAHNAIRNCSLVGGSAGYAEARKILKNRFGNDILVSQKLIDDLKQNKRVTSASDLQQLADDLVMAQAALSKIGKLHEIENQQTILEILDRCPRFVKDKWRKKALASKRDSGTYPPFSEFVKFISAQAEDWGDPVYGSQSVKSIKGSGVKLPSGSSHNISSTPKQQSPTPCVICNDNHRMFNCAKFRAMTPVARLQVVKDHKLCFVCGLPFHMSRSCKNQSVCPVPNCQRRHSKFIHIDPSPKNNPASDEDHLNVAGSGSTCAFGSNVYLPIIPVLVNGRRANALLDKGSTNTFVTKSLAKELGLTGKSHSYILKTVSHAEKTESQIVNVVVTSCDNTYTQMLNNVLVVSEIPAKLPPFDIDVSQYPHLSDILFPPVNKGSKVVDLLIGMDNPNLLLPLDVRYNPQCMKQIHATRHLLGWVINGFDGDSSIKEISSHFIMLEDKIDKLWDIEYNFVDDRKFSVEDSSEVLLLWQHNIKRVNGHYELQIPFKHDKPNFPNNRILAQCQLSSLDRRLAKLGIQKIYDVKMQRLIEKDYAERVPADQLTLNDGSVWYLCHHPVLGKKVRPVFNAALTYKGISLNGECKQGPNLTNDLIGVLLRFRQYRYALTGDIQDMYLQVSIPETQRNVLRYLWHDADGTVVENRMKSHLFGGIKMVCQFKCICT